jgi:hypothetical protein
MASSAAPLALDILPAAPGPRYAGPKAMYATAQALTVTATLESVTRRTIVGRLRAYRYHNRAPRSGHAPSPSQTGQSPVPSQDRQSPVPSQAGQSPEPSQSRQSPVPSQARQSPVPSQDRQSPVPSQAGHFPFPERVRLCWRPVARTRGPGTGSPSSSPRAAAAKSGIGFLITPPLQKRRLLVHVAALRTCALSVLLDGHNR